MKKSILGALPVGFVGTIYGVKFFLVHQYDITGDVTVQAYDDKTKELIFELRNNNKEQAEKKFIEYILNNPNYTFKNYKNRAEEEKAIRTKTKPFLNNLVKEIREYNKNKVKMPAKNKKTKRPVKAKAPAKQGRKAKPIHQVSVPNYSVAIDKLKKAKGPGKRKSASGRTYYESRVNRSDMPGSLTGYKYFNVAYLKSLDDLKKAYFSLSKKLHPDVGGNTADFQTMQGEYEMLMDAFLTEGNFSKEQIKNEIELDAAFQGVVNALAQYPQINIELIGSWIWVSGATFPIKDVLKQLGFEFAGKKKMWYINTTGVKTKRTKTLEIDEIRKKYGTKIITPKGDRSLNGTPLSTAAKRKLKLKFRNLIKKLNKAAK